MWFLKAGSYIGMLSEATAEDNVRVGDSVRPMLEDDEEEGAWVELARLVDEEKDMRCHVCGVEGEVEEMSDEEGEVVSAKEQGGEDVERLRAAKDERVVKEMGDPRRPTQKEVEDHERTHLPYRNWCSVCVRAKGKDADHRKGRRQRTRPE